VARLALIYGGRVAVKVQPARGGGEHAAGGALLTVGHGVFAVPCAYDAGVDNCHFFHHHLLFIAIFVCDRVNPAHNISASLAPAGGARLGSQGRVGLDRLFNFVGRGMAGNISRVLEWRHKFSAPAGAQERMRDTIATVT